MSGWDDMSGLKANLPGGGSANATVAGTTATDAVPVVSNAAPERTQNLEPWGKKFEYTYEEVGERNWDGNARVYEWDGEMGEIGPEHPELEKILFGHEKDRSPQGVDFKEITRITVTQEGLKRIDRVESFETAGLHPAMLNNIKLCGYHTPTPIQKYCIPAIKMGYDLLAIAQTGSGKTAAYLIPILNHLMGKAKRLAAPRPSPQEYHSGTAPAVRAEPLVVIVCPARELAVQIFNEARKFCYRTMLRPCVVYGGGPMREQVLQLQRGCDVLVASPGRLVALMNRNDVLTLRRLKYMVIDEADEMLDPDWEEEFNQILSGGEQEEGNVKYMLFSATFPVEIRRLARTYLSEAHIRLRVGRAGSTHGNIDQDIIWVDPAMKRQALLALLKATSAGRTIIFVNSKRTADEVDDFLFHHDVPSTSMHSDRTQREREDSMRAFRSGNAPVLVTTGVTARGIDVRNVAHVINYDLPSMDYGGIREYTHRIGRTGRIGHRGIATSFYTERDEPIAEVLALTLIETNQKIPDFLEKFVPSGAALGNLKFEPDSDEEDQDQDGGAGEPATQDSGSAVQEGWGGKSTTGKDSAGENDDQEDWGYGTAAAGGGDDAWGSGTAAADDETWQ